MGKAIHDQDNPEPSKNRREGGEQFNTDKPAESKEDNAANSEESTKQPSRDNTNESKGSMGSGQRQDAN